MTQDVMTREDVVDKLAEKTGILKKEARKVLAALPEIIRDGVLATGKVRIHSLGTFNLVHRAARQGRNPHTGEAVAIPPKKFVRFIPASAFKERLKHQGNPTR